MTRIAYLAALAVVLLPAAASAADLRGPFSPVVTATGWNGVYAGVVGGVGWGRARDFGWIGGVNGGYNVTFAPNMVAGFDADIAATSKSGLMGTTLVENPWDAAIRARVGYATLNAMVYAAGGIAFGDVRATTAGVGENATRVGWTLGVGVEAFMRDNLTARAEYRYTDLGTATFATNPSVRYRSSDILIGLDVKLF